MQCYIFTWSRYVTTPQKWVFLQEILDPSNSSLFNFDYLMNNAKYDWDEHLKCNFQTDIRSNIFYLDINEIYPAEPFCWCPDESGGLELSNKRTTWQSPNANMTNSKFAIFINSNGFCGKLNQMQRFLYLCHLWLFKEAYLTSIEISIATIICRKWRL